MPDATIQVGKSWAPLLVKEEHLDIPTDARELDRLLKSIKQSPWTLGEFLQILFTIPPREDDCRSGIHRGMVSQFLGGRSTIKAEEIVELMYSSRDSAPKAARTMTEDRPAHKKPRPDPKPMARHQLKEWAIQKVEGYVDKEAAEISGKSGGFHLSAAETTWDFLHMFSLASAVTVIADKGPILLRILVAAAIPAKKRSQNGIHSSLSGSGYATYFTNAMSAGSGSNRQNPFIILIVAFILLMCARNLQFSAFKKLVAIWLFANTASQGIFAVLSRIGLSASYTSTLKMLRRLSKSTQDVIRKKAPSRGFLLIYDNINRMQRTWDPDLGQKDTVNNGTAATYVEVEDCDVETAFNVQALEDAHNKRLREKLTVDVLYKRIDVEKLQSTLGLHCLRFLTEEVPSLECHKEFIDLRFRTSQAIHRMREGRKTTVQPLATSEHNEGTTDGQRNVFDDLNLGQLDLEKEEVARLLEILGGDQASVEKARTLKKFMASCPHGYARYGWVLPLIQLWHMGWADLERVLSTHWGKAKTDSELGDISSFYFTNHILQGKIKNVKRPDYYPAQRFIFDNLRVEVIDCWKVHLGTEDLEAYFESNPTSIEDLIALGEKLVKQYMTTEAYEHALSGDTKYGFSTGSPWTPPRSASGSTDSKPFRGDQILANTILRLRDSLLHYEFQFAVAEGDIGRAMNVMAVWVFTFTGCGKSKYSNELLELACNFEYEYSDALQKAIKNNWLCNLTGIPGCWFPMDLLQEHNIKQLKKMSMRRDAQWGGTFFKEIIAYNIRAFLQATESMKSAVHLAQKGGSHRRKVKRAVIKELAAAMTERELHKLRIGRILEHTVQDDFEEGYIALADGPKIKEFIHRTLLDAGNVNGDTEDEDDIPQGTNEDDLSDLPMPNTVMEGVLILGDESDEIDDDSFDLGMDADMDVDMDVDENIE